MTDYPHPIMLEQFRRLSDKLDSVLVEIRELKERDLSLRYHVRGLQLTDDAQSDALEDLKKRMERVERRLELADGPAVPSGLSEDAPPYQPRPPKRG